MYDKGGTLSPKVFSLYINGMTDSVFNSNGGCYNDKCINHNIMMHADIICFTPTGPAIQNLLDDCHDYGIANYI